MSKIDVEYHKLLNKILQEGYTYEDPNRKGVNRIEIPSYTFRHEFKDGFPAINTKKLHYKNVVTELIWFLRGDTNIKYLVDNGCNIWNKDAYNYYLKQAEGQSEKVILTFKEWLKEIKNGEYFLGDLGPVYGEQWRNIKQPIYEYGNYVAHNRLDQISNLIKGLKEKPLGTQHVVNSWNVGDLEDMALQPCHYGFQIVVRLLSLEEKENICKNLGATWDLPFTEKIATKWNVPKYGFELHWSQRSVDTFLGLPYNIASYATLALILEKITGHKALGIQGDLKKVHLYDNSLDAVKEQLSRNVNKCDKCELDIDDILSFELIKKDINYLDEGLLVIGAMDFELQNYESYPALAVEMLERDE